MYRFWADSIAIKENSLTGSNKPMIAVEISGKRINSVTSIKILGESCVRTDTSRTPQVWIETDSEVIFS